MARSLEHKIDTLESLQLHLQWAMEVEHFTIPPYLCALYSIPDGQNTKAASIIKSVVMEEMLHMVLVANLMNAIGIQPVLDRPGFIPQYPCYMPHSGTHFKVGLEKFSRNAIQTFMDIESPRKVGEPVNPDHYHHIGELYMAIEEGFKNLKHKNIFVGKKKNQITAEHYYGGGGIAMEVFDLESALAVIAEIMEQGEGQLTNPDDEESIYDGDEKYGQEPEVAHYYRFMEIKMEKNFAPHDTPKSGPTGDDLPVSWNQVYPMRKNPKVSKYSEGSEIREAMNDFNGTYTMLLRKLQFAFSGNPEALTDAVTVMYKLKYKAIALMRIPSGKGKTTVGPSFEYYSAAPEPNKA